MNGGWYAGERPPNLRSFPTHAGEYYLYNDVQVEGCCSIGRFTYIGEHSLISARSSVTIGSFCSIAAGFRCLTHSQPRDGQPINYPLREILGLPIGGTGLPLGGDLAHEPRPIVIGNDVWIGHGVTVCGNTTIGDGCVIGAKSVLEGEYIPYGIYAGNPAKLIRMRFPEPIVEQLKELEWWDWELACILDNAEFFGTDLTNYTGRLEDLLNPKWANAA